MGSIWPFFTIRYGTCAGENIDAWQNSDSVGGYSYFWVLNVWRPRQRSWGGSWARPWQQRWTTNKSLSMKWPGPTSDQLVAETKSMCTNMCSRPERDFIRNHLLEIIAHLKRWEWKIKRLWTLVQVMHDDDVSWNDWNGPRYIVIETMQIIESSGLQVKGIKQMVFFRT